MIPLTSLLAAALAVAAAAPREQSTLVYERFQLDNGLDVITHDDRRFPVVAVEVRYRVGSRHDPSDKRGMAHLTEHLSFRGTRHTGDHGIGWPLQRARAVGSNGSTSPDATSYVVTMPANKLAVALWVESDRMGFFPEGLTRRTLLQEQEVIAQELRERKEQAATAIASHTAIDLLVGDDHPDRFAAPTSLSAVEADDVRVFAERYYGPANAILVLAGALPSDTRTLVEKYFRRLRKVEPPDPVDVFVGPSAEKRVEIASVMTDTPVVAVVWTSPGLFAPGDADADVLADVLARGSARLREDGVIAGLDAHQQSRAGQSYFIVVARGTKGSASDDVLAELDRRLQPIEREGIDEPELVRAHAAMRLAVLRRLQTLQGRASMLATYAAAGLDPDSVAWDLRRHAEVTSESVRGFVKERLVPNRRAVVHLVPAEHE